ncbi:hypothetical protein A5785_08645 [Gordonia sp. 852002-50395_SCH5434458]|uniref:Uncharacterized protein n=2 Tax=Gordoniaceae TaxID=85026 RepID=H5U4U6_9ACTN|nr:hypothetical protein A5766_06395 [Gordonia sp. 852002-51296_SCH5728562-b]OBC07261.1 hypothetical protein A5785_08645 [Gordonia sp. 852002-50395_SCH5434458]GAB40754.1 hypothetical protein GOSPT_115_00110 [Gordonia sputi NBRC 100414]
MSGRYYEHPDLPAVSTGTGSRNSYLFNDGGAHATSNGRTPWASMSVAEILAKIESITDSSASGDANAIQAALDAVGKVVKSLTSAFGDDTMLGRAADGSTAAGAGVGKAISAAAESVRPAIDALAQAQDVLTATSQQAGAVRHAAAQIRAHPEDASTLRAEVVSLMEGVYTNPMVSVQTWLPELPAASSDPMAGSDSGQGVVAGTGAGSGRTQSGNVADSDLSGSAGPGSSGEVSTSPSTPAPASPAAGGVGPGGPSSSTGTSAAGTADADADRLTRGGFGSADSAAASTPVSGIGGPGAADSGRTGSLGAGRSGSSGLGAGQGVGAGSGSALAPSLGASRPPGLGTAPSTPAMSASPSAGPAMRSGPNSAMPPASGGGARDRGDNKHQSARYLNTREHGEEIVGDLPLVGPPVIGDWTPQSMPPLDPAADTSASEPKVDAQRSGAHAEASRERGAGR